MIIFLVIVVLLVLCFIVNYNALVKLRNRVRDQWAQIDVLLKRRFDLIPNVVETIKGYASHEKDTLEAVVSARNKAVSATNSKDEIEANGELTKALGRLFALTEAYPELKSNDNFLKLQEDLKDTEDKISYARQFYNDAVLTYNNKVQTIPSNIVASIAGFKTETFFEVSQAEKETPKVQF